MLVGLREAGHRAKPSFGERMAYKGWTRVLRRPWLYRLATHVARLILRPGPQGWLRRLPGPASGWTASRDFPAPAARSFRERWHSAEGRAVAGRDLDENHD